MFKGTRLKSCPHYHAWDMRVQAPHCLVPEEGLEPSCPEGQRILSPSRLPFRHSGPYTHLLQASNLMF